MTLLLVIVAFIAFCSGFSLALSVGMASEAEKAVERGASALFGFCAIGLIAVAALGWVS